MDVQVGEEDVQAHRGRFRLGVALMVLSLVPFLVSIWLVANHDDRNFAAVATAAMYGLSVLLWYVGLFFVGGRVVDKWRARRRQRRKPPEPGD